MAALRIALVAPPMVRIPPQGYAGTERIVAALALGLHARGHEVTVFASGDSELPCEVVPIVPRALWSRGDHGDHAPYTALAVARVWSMAEQFDVIHSHLETAAFLLARHGPTPVVTTFHQRLDTPGVADLLDEFTDIPLVAISASQRRWHPEARWVATIHHGLDFSAAPKATEPGSYLLLIGRISKEKGVAEAIELARRVELPLVMAAKVRHPSEQALFETIVQPAIDDGTVDWRGEVDGPERDRLMAGALATLMLGAWPEPFGLVAIESMATGTPVIARRAGGNTETIEHGVTGFLVDDLREAELAVTRLGRLNREHIAGYARGRFSAERMTTLYEQVYAELAAEAGRPQRLAKPVAPVEEPTVPIPAAPLATRGPMRARLATVTGGRRGA